MLYVTVPRMTATLDHRPAITRMRPMRPSVPTVGIHSRVPRGARSPRPRLVDRERRGSGNIGIGMGVAWNFSTDLLTFVERLLTGHTYLVELKAKVYEAVWCGFHCT